MRNGKKSTIEKIVHPIFINFKSQTPTENMEMFLITNLEQLKLPIEIRTRTRRGKSIAIPFPVKLKRQYVNVLTSIIAEIKNKKNFKNKLQYRILACFSTLNKSKENIEKNKFFKKKVELRDFIQENKTNKRFR
jgi:ribosomal protein S7